jgi:hypothetical protein
VHYIRDIDIVNGVLSIGFVSVIGISLDITRNFLFSMGPEDSLPYHVRLKGSHGGEYEDGCLPGC